MILGINGILAGRGADTDALAFITAANITDATQKSAVTQLVTDLKSANIWSKMKAIYPFVGGTAAQHRFNLKSPGTNASDFYLTFNGGWTHSSTGAKPNGTNGYAETNFVVKNNMDYTSLLHFSYYSRTNTTLSTNPPYRYDMGVENYNGATYVGGASLNIRRSDNSTFWYSQFGLNTAYNYSGGTNTANSLGLFVGNTTATNTKLVKNNTTLIQNQGASSSAYDLMNSLATSSVWIGTLNEPNYVAQNRFTDKEAAFISIGWGLTDAELTSLYNAVNAYQVALSRNV